MRTKVLLLLVLFTAPLLVVGCASSIQYIMEKPAFTRIDITGLSYGDRLVEVSDENKGDTIGNSIFWCAVKVRQGYDLGELNAETGEITDLHPFPRGTYGPSRSIYWTTFRQQGLNFGQALLGAALSLTPIGGTTEKYGLYAEKDIWGNPNNVVQISYQYRKEESTQGYGKYYRKTSTNVESGATQSFLRGDKVATINIATGYKSILGSRIGKYARYYPVDEDDYLGFQPAQMLDGRTLYVYAYALNFADVAGNQKSFGAILKNLPGDYVDACVSQNGKTTFLVLQNPRNKRYFIEKASSIEFIRNAEMFMAVQ